MPPIAAGIMRAIGASDGQSGEEHQLRIPVRLMTRAKETRLKRRIVIPVIVTPRPKLRLGHVACVACLAVQLKNFLEARALSPLGEDWGEGWNAG